MDKSIEKLEKAFLLWDDREINNFVSFVISNWKIKKVDKKNIRRKIFKIKKTKSVSSALAGHGTTTGQQEVRDYENKRNC